MVKIVNPLGDVKIGRQGEVVYQRKYGEQIRRQVSPKRAIASEAQIAHRQLYRDALAWRKLLSRANRRYLDGYCIANGIVDSYHIPLPWSRFALKVYLQAIKFVPDLVVTQEPPIAGEKKDWNTPDFYSNNTFGLAQWFGQTFTPLEDYTVGKVVAYLSKGATIGILTAAIRATDGEGKPTGEDLAIGTTDGDTLLDFTTFEWREIELTPYELKQGIKYALILRAPEASKTSACYWKCTQYDTAYPRGQFTYSTNSGSSWTLLTIDSNFQVWSAEQEGAYTKEGILHIRHPALMKVVHKRGELTINGYDTLSSLDEEYLTGQVGLDVEVGDSIKATTLPGIKYAYLVR